MTRSENIAELAAALAVAQGSIQNAAKDSANPFFNSSYADLASVRDAIREPFSANGLSVIQMPTADGNKVTVTTILAHKSGEWVASDLTMVSEKSTPQAIGSAITYARRYALAAVSGVAPEDDDGEGAHDRKKAAQDVAKQKIARGKPNGAAASEPTERTYEPDEPVSLHDEIVEAEQVEKKSTSRAYDKYKMFAALDEVKARFIAIGAEAEYRAVLGKYGATKRNELPDNDGGKAARSAYKELTLAISDLEVVAIKEGKLPNPFLPDLQDYPSEVQAFCRVKGELFKYVDDEAGSGYRPWPAKKAGK